MTTHTLNFIDSNDLMAFIERDDLRSFRKFLREQQRQDRNVDTLLKVEDIVSFHTGNHVVSATFLYYSCFYGAVKIVEFLLSEEKANVNIRSVVTAKKLRGKAPIGVVCRSGILTQNECTILRLLVDNGANQHNPLNLAYYDQNMVNLIRVLVDNGANVIKLLLESGADQVSAEILLSHFKFLLLSGDQIIHSNLFASGFMSLLFSGFGTVHGDIVGYFKELLSRSADQLQNVTGYFLGFDANKKKAIVDKLTFCCCPLTMPAESQKKAIQQRKRKREQSETTANGMVSAAMTMPVNIETSARINIKLTLHQRLIAHKACHMMSKLPIRDLRFEVLGYLTTADVEQIFE